MSEINFPSDDNSICSHIRVAVATFICLGLASVILWGIVPVYDPEATLHNLNFNQDASKMYINIELTNPNYFRGFNYTSSGWIKVFYLSATESNLIVLKDTPFPEIQGFRDPLKWDMPLDVNSKYVDIPTLKTRDARIYVSMFLAYKQKILLWQTNTIYYQYLDIFAYLNGSLDLDKATNFNRTRDFILTFQT